jgi:hypothetical protein
MSTVRTNRRRFPPDGRGDVGRAAEAAVLWNVRQRLRRTTWTIHHGIRVPGSRGGRREIDFVVTTPTRAIVVELKHWAGEAILVDGDAGPLRLVQRRPPPKAPTDHGPVLEQLAHKTALLQRHHAARGGSEIDLEPLLMFYDVRLRLGSGLVDRADVVMYERFLEALPRADDTPASPDIAGFRETLDGLGGWDLVALHGGRVVSCDIRETPIGDRRTDRGVDLRIDRSLARALVSAPRARAVVHRRSGEIIPAEVDPAAEVVFRPAGRKQPERVALRHFETLVFGGAG